MERRPRGRRSPLRLAQRLRRQEPPAAQEHRAHRGRPRLRRRPGKAGPHPGVGAGPDRPAHEGVEALQARGTEPLGQPRRLRRPPKRPRGLALLPGVGEKGGAPLDDGDAARPLSALLLISQSHQRPRRQSLRPDRLRRRHRRHQLPESGARRDGPRRGQCAPVGLPQRDHRRAGPAGKGVEDSRATGSPPTSC